MKPDTEHGSAGLRRRAFLRCIAVASMVRLSGAASAQTKGGPALVGWLHFGSQRATGPALAAFREGLAALGWKEGAHVVIEARWADGQTDRLESLAAELAAREPAVIVANTLRVATVLSKAAPKTPIVQSGGADPVAQGLAASLARPGGMLTGLTSITAELSEKYFELLLAAMPGLRRTGVLVDRNAVNLGLQTTAAQRAATQHKLDARIGGVAKREDIEPVLADLAKQGVEALVVVSSPMLFFERRHIVNLAMAHRWPAISEGVLWVEAGALLSYGADRSHNHRRAAYFVDRILKGAAPGELPIEQPTRFVLGLNLRTAKALGLAIPQALLVRANRLIE